MTTEVLQQEPYAWFWCHGGDAGVLTNDADYQYYKKIYPNMIVTPVFTVPPKREWVGLTHDELIEIYNEKDWDTTYGWDYEQAIEAKLKEKNHD